jgi:hypothetical protein
LKNLKVSEGTADNADVTVVVKDEALADYGAKKITLEEAKVSSENFFKRFLSDFNWLFLCRPMVTLSPAVTKN